MRPLTSYTKVQIAIGALVRGRQLFVRPKGFAALEYLDVGCGPFVNTNDFVNLDYEWRPGVQVCWDIVKWKLPFPDNRFRGIYTEHCLEHITLDNAADVISEFHRILKPGGRARIIVPDGELYFDLYQQQKLGVEVKMPYQESYVSPMARVNGLFRNHGHQFIFDFNTLSILLTKAGFRDIRKSAFREGIDPVLLKDSEYRRNESLYVEAVK
jgi:predicted SAM-dependent methyltransferase